VYIGISKLNIAGSGVEIFKPGSGVEKEMNAG